MSSRPLELWAHRGAHHGQAQHGTGPEARARGDGPLENTLPAFEQALREGCDGVELDVHASADGVPMVFHDERLERLVPGDPRALRDVPAAELGALRLVGGHRMPTLAEVLDLLYGRARVNIEFKDAAALGPLLAVLDGRRDGLMLSSFDLDGVRAAADRAPHLPRAAIMGDKTLNPWVRLREACPLPALVRCRATDWHAHPLLIRRAWVAALHALGARVRAWTVNDADLARALIAKGVDGVFTDRPAGLRAELF